VITLFLQGVPCISSFAIFKVSSNRYK
jgi:uncharacterized protein with WD repeat